jgi:protein ImuB
MRRVVSLFLPSWSTDRVRLHEAAAGTAAPMGVQTGAQTGILVLAARQGSRRLITAVSAGAAALGLFTGMAVSQAQAMVPGLCLGEADPEGDLAALQRLAVWCLRLSPLAAPCAPDGVWIDSTGCAHLHGGEARMLGRLVQRLAEAGIAARAAMAGTPGCAHAVARFGTAAITIVPPAGAAAAMARLPVPALRVAPETAEALGRLGFDTVGQLMAAPRAPLTRRFGATALRRLDQALGRVPEPIEPILPPDLCRVRQSFPEPVCTPEDLGRVIEILAAALCEKLHRRDEGACRLDLVFTRVDGSAAMARIGTAAPTRDAAHLTRLLLAQIETIDPGFGVETAMLAAPLVQRLGARQTLSALTTPPETDLSGLVDMLCNRLGPSRVFRTRPVESDIPERSVARVAPSGAPSAVPSGVPSGAPGAAPGAGSWPVHWPRPPRLLHPPRPIEAVALLPDQPPVRFTWRRVAHRVRRADGPERVFGEWWLNEAEIGAVRDYFQVEDEAGQRFWIFREGDGQDPETGRLDWFLHGFFG